VENKAKERRSTESKRFDSQSLESAIAKATEPTINDGGGLYLRRWGANWYWYFRALSPVTKKRLWVPLCEGKPYSPSARSISSLAKARIDAERVRVQVREGIDPQVEKQKRVAAEQNALAASREQERRAVTLRQVFDQWRATDLQPRTRADGKRTGRKDGGHYVFEQFQRHVFATLGDVPIANIRKPDVFAILDARKAFGHLRTANVLLADLKQLFHFASDREIIEASPIESIRKEKVGGADTARTRFLSESEIRTLFNQMPSARLTKRTELAIAIMLATGARVGELMGAAWHDHQSLESKLVELADKTDVKFGTVNLTKREWYLPETKNQRDHTIHISDFAVSQFEQLASLRDHEAWLFPGRYGNAPVGVKSFGKQLADRQRTPDRRIKNRTLNTESLMLEGGRWTAHDLRRTAATVMAQLGISNDVINECLNHKQADRMSHVYIQNRREAEQIVAFDALGKKLESIIHGNEQTNVVPLSNRKKRA
jgi:integrase